MKQLFAIPVILLFIAGAAHADKGPVLWHKDVNLSQESQKAIIFHNAKEEVLILGTELKASRETEILEFIPFPSEPEVSLAKGNPLEEAARLIDRKGLVFEFASFGAVKGGGEKTTAPVEIRLSKKIGLHDVTVVKIHAIDRFDRWLEDFFKSKGIQADREKLSAVYRNAQDYIGRGIHYFVFDQVRVSESVRLVEPLIYRFKADRIYYPLKTSNLIGGTGAVEMILVLPGSITEDIWRSIWKIFSRGGDSDIKISSSSKVYPDELTALYPDASFFHGSAKIYLQVVKYSGAYDFKDDFTYSVEKLVPYAYRHAQRDPIHDAHFTPPLTRDERRDMREAVCPPVHSKPGFNVYLASVLDCWSFIPNDEYDVYAALFRQGKLPGIPAEDVVLEKTTLRKEYGGGKADAAMAKDFNDKNRAGYDLENAFPPDGRAAIKIRDDRKEGSTLGIGRTYISRAGFNKERTRALLYVAHVESRPRSLVGYFVVLEKKGKEWSMAGSELAAGY
jgi:hypothetical protein